MIKLLKPFYDAKLLTILLLGFVSGLPFLLTLSTLSYWLAEVGISNTTIGLFMLASLPYSFKFLWAPLLDHIRIPFLTAKFGKRRSWLLLMQTGLILSLLLMSYSNPSETILLTAISAFLVSFFSASQDIIIDAYRIETIQSHNRGYGAALETIGFRFGMLASGAGALYLANLFDWQTAYHLMAGSVLISMILSLNIPEPIHTHIVRIKPRERNTSVAQRSKDIFALPLRQFAHRDQIIVLLAFIFFFKLSDTVMNAMSAPFLCDLGFSKVEFANVSKLFGISLMVVGGLLGAVMIQQLGAFQSAIMCAVLQGLSCLMFTIQALAGYDPYILMITVGVESLCSGISATVFIAFISLFCNKPHTASHFTLLYSFGSLSRVIISAGAGWLADTVTWHALFLLSAAAIFPTIYFLARISPDKLEEFSDTTSKVA